MILGFLGTMVPAVAMQKAARPGLTPPAKTDSDAEAAWVVFHGQADLPWLRLLRPGFRHCYVVLRSGDRWLSLDPLLNRLEVQMHGDLPLEFDLPGWLAGRGHTVIRAVIDRTQTRPAPWRPFTCVEAVKRVLGLHHRFMLTPWQLYRHLARPSPLPSSPRRRGSHLRKWLRWAGRPVRRSFSAGEIPACAGMATINGGDATWAH